MSNNSIEIKSLSDVLHTTLNAYNDSQFLKADAHTQRTLVTTAVLELIKAEALGSNPSSASLSDNISNLDTYVNQVLAVLNKQTTLNHKTEEEQNQW